MRADFSPVAVSQATHQASLFGLAGRARFVIGDLARTGPPQASADAAVSIDAFHFAADPAASVREVRRVLRPGLRLALTNWQPKVPDHPRLPDRARIDWPQLLHSAGFTGIEIQAGLSGTTRTPAYTRSPSTSAIPATTPRSPNCKTRPVAARPVTDLIMHKDRAAKFGHRDAVTGEVVVRITPERVIAQNDIAGY